MFHLIEGDIGHRWRASLAPSSRAPRGTHVGPFWVSPRSRVHKSSMVRLPCSQNWLPLLLHIGHTWAPLVAGYISHRRCISLAPETAAKGCCCGSRVGSCAARILESLRRLSPKPGCAASPEMGWALWCAGVQYSVGVPLKRLCSCVNSRS